MANPISALALTVCTGGAAPCAGQPDVQTGKSAALHHDLLSCPPILLHRVYAVVSSTWKELDLVSREDADVLRIREEVDDLKLSQIQCRWPLQV